jgi:hypothetical protein
LKQADTGRMAVPDIGDTVWLIPGHCDPTVNLHDRDIGVRGWADARRRQVHLGGRRSRLSDLVSRRRSVARFSACGAAARRR